MYRRFQLDGDAAGSALQEGHQESTLALRRSLTCCVFELPRGGLKLRFDQQHLNVLGLLPSEEASQEALLGRLMHDLDDSQRCQLLQLLGAGASTQSLQASARGPAGNLTYREFTK